MSEPTEEQLAAMVMIAAKLPETDIVWKLYSLHKQATQERSHFYVGSIANRAIGEILALRTMLSYASREAKRLAGNGSESQNG